jgi:hypothetical protein
MRTGNSHVDDARPLLGQLLVARGTGQDRSWAHYRQTAVPGPGSYGRQRGGLPARWVRQPARPARPAGCRAMRAGFGGAAWGGRRGSRREVQVGRGAAGHMHRSAGSPPGPPPRRAGHSGPRSWVAGRAGRGLAEARQRAAERRPAGPPQAWLRARGGPAEGARCLCRPGARRAGVASEKAPAARRRPPATAPHGGARGPGVGADGWVAEGRVEVPAAGKSAHARARAVRARRTRLRGRTRARVGTDAGWGVGWAAIAPGPGGRAPSLAGGAPGVPPSRRRQQGAGGRPAPHPPTPCNAVPLGSLRAVHGCTTGNQTCAPAAGLQGRRAAAAAPTEGGTPAAQPRAASRAARPPQQRRER